MLHFFIFVYKELKKFESNKKNLIFINNNLKYAKENKTNKHTTARVCGSCVCLCFVLVCIRLLVLLICMISAM